MNLTQQEAYTYLSKFGLKPIPEHQALSVGEESGEVLRAILKRAQAIRGTYEYWTEEIRKEAGDVIISLMCLAEMEGFDLDKAVDDRWDYVINRNMEDRSS